MGLERVLHYSYTIANKLNPEMKETLGFFVEFPVKVTVIYSVFCLSELCQIYSINSLMAARLEGNMRLGHL